MTSARCLSRWTTTTAGAILRRIVGPTGLVVCLLSGSALSASPGLSGSAAPGVHSLSGDSAGETQESSCDVPPEGVSTEEVEPARRLRGAAPLSPRELEKYSPLWIAGVITCRGKLVQVEVPEDLPKKIEKKLRKALETWLFEPARHEGEPVAVHYRVALRAR